MADHYDRPGHKDSRPGGTMTRPDADELRELTGVSPEEEQQMEDNAYDGAAGDMAEREGLDNLDGGDSGKNEDLGPNKKREEHRKDSDSSTDEGERDLAPNIGKGKDAKGGLRARIINRKTAIGGGIAGLLLGGGFGVLTLVSGPAQVIHFAQFLDNIHFSRNRDSSESRIGRMFEYFRTQNDPSKRNVGYTMEKITDRYMKGLVRDGITMDFTNPDGSKNRQLQKLVMDPSTDAGKRQIDTLRKQGFEVGNDGVLDLRGNGASARRRRNALKIAVESEGKSKISSAIQKRLLIHRAGVDFHPYRNVKRRAGERLVDWRTDRKKERAEKHRNGSENPLGDTGVEGDTDEVTDPETGETTEVENPSNNELANQASPGLEEGKTAGLDPPKRLDFAKKLVRGGGYAAAAIGVLCAVKDLGNNIEGYRHQYVNLVLMRQAFSIVSAASQIQAGRDINMEEVGVTASDFYDEETGTSVWSAPAVLAAQDKPFSETNDVTVKPTSGKDKPELFDIVDNIPVLATACAVQSGIGSLLKKVPLVGNIIELQENVVTWGIDGLLSPFGLTMDELMDKVVAALAGDVVDVFATGAQLGGNSMIGALLAANDAAIAVGGTLLDAVSVRELDSKIAMEQRQEFQSRSLSDRMFDIYDPSSFVGKAIMQSTSFASLGSMMSSLASMPTNIFSLFGNGFSSLLSPVSAAGTYDYNYGVGVYGFSTAELENPAYADPYENEDWIKEARGGITLEELNEKYGKCFATTVNPTSGKLDTKETPTYETVTGDDCTRDRGTEAFDRYRFYLLDAATAKSLACYEGTDEAACDEMGIGSSSSGTTNEGGGGTFGGPTYPCEGQQRAVVKGGFDSAVWDDIAPSGTAGNHADGTPINVYVRDACTDTNVKTVVILGSIHGSENGGQLVAWDMLFNASLPNNVRVVAIPEYCACAGTGVRGDSNNIDPDNNLIIDLNRNFNYNWSTLPKTQGFDSGSTYSKGPVAESEPETKGITGFLSNLGTINLFVVYHDALGYVAASGNTDTSIATTYATHTPDTPLRNREGGKVFQGGSIDGWVNQQFGIPSLLVEMSNNQAQSIIDGHVNGLRAALEQVK